MEKCQRDRLHIKVTIEPSTKPLSIDQKTLYNAFIIRTSQHFGIRFSEMEVVLEPLKPIDPVNLEPMPVKNWNTEQLNNFIEDAKAYIAEQDSNFEF